MAALHPLVDPVRLAQITQEAEQGHWFWSHVQVGEGCWCWLAGKSGEYGRCAVAGRDEKAHRVAYSLVYGPIPGGVIICHECDNPPCVRPDHLFPGTVAINNADRAAKGRSKGVFRSDATHPARVRAGEKHWCAKLSAAEVEQIRARRAAGETVTSLAECFSVHHATISRIARREWRTEVA